ncbi:hypothetical protein V8E53_014282 [Lactarius tabidus]
MDPSQSNSREYQLQAIDAEIKSLEESIRALRRRRNALAPISSLPTEVITTVFTLLRGPLRGAVAPSPLTLFNEWPDRLPWIRVAHVCHHWRELALNQPLLWSHVDFTLFSSTGTAEILARAKMVPLHLEAMVPIGHWNNARFSAFRNELQAHVSHICHLGIGGEHLHLRKTLEGLVSAAPTLEYLSLSCETYRNRAISSRVAVPDNIFDGTTPRLSSLVLSNCDISWKSPLLRGLKHLDIHAPFERPGLSAWLDMLCEMAQLKTLILHWATPAFPPDAPLPSDVERIVTLPSIVNLDISTSARDCGQALAHLILPALTRLSLAATSCHFDGSDVQDILPYVSQHSHRLQCTQPLQSVCIRRNKTGAEIFVWSVPDIDDILHEPIIFLDAMLSAPLVFSFTNEDWSPRSYTGIFDAALAALPLDNVVTLISRNRRSPFEMEVWFHQAARWPLLQRVYLSTSAARGFMEMLLEDNGGCESPLLPSLTTLVLDDTELSSRRTLRLYDALMKRVEQRVPLETLDLSTCVATSRAVDLLSEIVVDVLGPADFLEESEEMTPMWDVAARGFTVEGDSSEEDYDEDDDPETRSYDEVWDDEDTDEEGLEYDVDEADYW